MKWTIRRKFLVGFLLLFSTAALIIYQVMTLSLQSNSETIIKNELAKLQQTTREYVKQFMLLHPYESNFFAEFGSVIAQDLSALHQQSVALYNERGEFLFEAVPIEQPQLMTGQQAREMFASDIALALDNQAAFTLVDVDGIKLSYFSYPLYIQDRFYGIMRFTGDYTYLFTSNQQILRGFTLFTVILFLAVFLFSLLLTRKMMQPLTNLITATKQVASGNYNLRISLKTGDEFEQLTDSFNEMSKEIKQKINQIEAEKDRVLLLEKSRRSFFNNVTHELKTPLTTISGYAQIIGEDDFNDKQFLQKAAQKIHEESDRLGEMVNKLINLSKNESAMIAKEKEVIELRPFLFSICEDMNLKAEKYGMQIQLYGDNSKIYAVKDEMKQMFINLLDNAIKHGINDKNITVTITKSESETFIIIKNESEPIDKAISTNIFEPFIHNPRKKMSSGLGLYICKEMIEYHNGTIEFNYEDGKAIFKINIPRWQQISNN